MRMILIGRKRNFICELVFALKGRAGKWLYVITINFPREQEWKDTVAYVNQSVAGLC